MAAAGALFRLLCRFVAGNLAAFRILFACRQLVTTSRKSSGLQTRTENTSIAVLCVVATEVAVGPPRRSPAQWGTPTSRKLLCNKTASDLLHAAMRADPQRHMLVTIKRALAWRHSSKSDCPDSNSHDAEGMVTCCSRISFEAGALYRPNTSIAPKKLVTRVLPKKLVTRVSLLLTHPTGGASPAKSVKALYRSTVPTHAT